MKRKFSLAGFFLSILIWSASSVPGQVVTGTIYGTVEDATGGLVPGVQTTIQNIETGLSRPTITGETGCQLRSSCRTGGA